MDVEGSVSEFHPRVIAAQRAQLRERRASLDRGAGHVGWKVGLGIPGAEELIGDEPVFGHLTSASRFASGDVFTAGGARKLQVDCELAVELGHDVDADDGRELLRRAISGVATGLELCDVARPPDDFDGIVAANVFHHAFTLGPSKPPSGDLAYAGRVRVNGELRHQGTSADVLERLAAVARLLEATGERLRAGDRIICGAVCGGLVARGDQVEVEVGDLGVLRVAIGA